MKDRDITAEGLLGCTYDEYDRYRYLCKWPIWRVYSCRRLGKREVWH